MTSVHLFGSIMLHHGAIVVMISAKNYCGTQWHSNDSEFYAL
jgi:hypothetical protein